MWPDNRVLDLFGIQSPIIQAPMAGSVLSDMVVAVSEAVGLGSLPCALLCVDQARTELETIRRQTSRPINLNFFCHQPPLWSGQAARLSRELPAAELTKRLAAEALETMRSLRQQGADS